MVLDLGESSSLKLSLPLDAKPQMMLEILIYDNDYH